MSWLAGRGIDPPSEVNARASRRLMQVMTGLPVRIADPPELLARERQELEFATLVGAYQPIVFRWAIALSGDQDEADDITQKVFVRVHRKLACFRGDGPFEAWLYRITRRRTPHPNDRAAAGVYGHAKRVRYRSRCAH
jgi:hypothetical protein